MPDQSEFNFCEAEVQEYKTMEQCKEAYDEWYKKIVEDPDYKDGEN